MAKRSKRKGKRKRRAPQVYRTQEACQLVTERTPRGRRRIVECVTASDIEAAGGVEEAFAEVCKTNESCACGVSYDKFRSGWSFRDAAEMLGARGGAEFRPSRGRVLWMLSRLKRDEWEMHQKACAAGGADAEVEVEDLEPYPWADADAEFAGLKGWR